MPDGLTPRQYVRRAQHQARTRQYLRIIRQRRAEEERRNIPVGDLGFVWQPYKTLYISPQFVLRDGRKFGEHA